MVAASVATTLRRSPAAPYDVAFLDPPYPIDAGGGRRRPARLLDQHDWLVPGAMVVVERSSRSDPPDFPDGFTDLRERRYGETTLWYGHAAPSAARPSTPPAAEE